MALIETEYVGIGETLIDLRINDVLVFDLNTPDITPPPLLENEILEINSQETVIGVTERVLGLTPERDLSSNALQGFILGLKSNPDVGAVFFTNSTNGDTESARLGITVLVNESASHESGIGHDSNYSDFETESNMDYYAARDQVNRMYRDFTDSNSDEGFSLGIGLNIFPNTFYETPMSLHAHLKERHMDNQVVGASFTR